MLAPEPYLSACLAVLHHAAVAGRLLGWQGLDRGGLSVEHSEYLADLMDAVHNLPGLIHAWERCDEALLCGMLADFDAKWRGCASFELLEVYRQRLVVSVRT